MVAAAICVTDAVGETGTCSVVLWPVVVGMVVSVTIGVGMT